MALDVLNLIDKAVERASAPRKSGKPVFLFLKEGHKALIRPLFNLDEAIVLAKHNKWSENADYRVNAICAAELGKACVHCESAKTLEDKKLAASATIYLPVYIYQVVDKTGTRVTYKEKDEQGNESEKPVTGFRVLELPLFGTMFNVLKVFRSYMRDDGSICQCDFSIEQVGEGQKKSFVVIPKAPKPLGPAIQKAAAALDIVKFHDAIMGALPPSISGDDTVSPAKAIEQAMNSVEGSDEIPGF